MKLASVRSRDPRPDEQPVAVTEHFVGLELRVAEGGVKHLEHLLHARLARYQAGDLFVFDEVVRDELVDGTEVSRVDPFEEPTHELLVRIRHLASRLSDRSPSVHAAPVHRTRSGCPNRRVTGEEQVMRS
jgi:hypothetical protein